MVSFADIQAKLTVLSGAAKYDVSCVSSGSRRRGVKGGVGSTAPSGICHSFTSDGRCVSLLKILFTNDCIFDCSYCVNRRSNDVPRASFTEGEVAALTMEFYHRNYIEGLFLSSAITRSPDYTMERLVRTVKDLRLKERFNGYIHLKALPGASKSLIIEAGSYVDRLSANIELPSRESLKLLAPQKSGEGILSVMKSMGAEITRYREEKEKSRKAPPFIPAGQSTQLIVGASPESDSTILRLSEFLYRRFSLKRVFYSAYIPVNESPHLPAPVEPPLLREHRLYQADWLLRFYGFASAELFGEQCRNLDERWDPKTGWALAHPEFFPLEVNSAPYEALVRVPGIGTLSAKRIIAARKLHSLSLEDLARIGVVMKRARFFVMAAGKYWEKIPSDISRLQDILTAPKAVRKTDRPPGGYEQLPLFPEYERQKAGYLAAVTGEF
ncbi:MAG: putative DNA modification/repair radical SAM protein [Candidatus Eremiobacteraeota bacterium]|nr:putative DNA modification/repair radical SAM protein [Candidatus Eremiobacteraeota bacterium]